MSRLLLPCLAASLLWTSVLADHDRDRGRDRDAGRNRGACVIFYEHANFQGDALVLYPGDEIESFSDHRFPGGGKLNDRVSSVCVQGGARVAVYEDAGFRGAALRLEGDVRDLSRRSLPGAGSWNDRISSVRIEEEKPRPRGRVEDVDPQIHRVYRELLGYDADAAVLRYYRSRMLDDGWSVAMVRDRVKQSDEYRVDGVTRIIHRAYRDILGREPDESGMNNFRRHMLKDGWSEADLRDALMRSDEYRQRVRR